MRGLFLLRTARQAVLAAEPLGCALAGESAACGSGSSGAAPLRQLVSLLGLPGQRLAPPAPQRQQAAGYAAGRRRDDDDNEEEEEPVPARPGQHNKLSHSKRRLLIERKLQRSAEEEDEEVEEGEEDAAAAAERHLVIKRLLNHVGEQDAGGAASFVSSFFQERQQAAAAAAAGGSSSLRYQGEGGRYGAAAAAGGEGDEEAGEEEEEQEVLGEEEQEEAETFQVGLPEALDEEEEFDLMSKLQGLRPGSRRIVLDKLLSGGIMRADPSAMREWQAIAGQFEPPENFRMKVVDVNYTSKGTRTGGLYRYGCMVVVGNGNGVLGWGQGKAAEVSDAVQKAYQRACRNLYPVPRYNDHTIPEPIKSKYGQVKLTLYPKASGNGITANSLMREICKMAGIHDIGIKVHGSRNTRNAVKCLFQAFDKMRTEDQIAAAAAARGSVAIKMPPGRYRHINL